MKMKILSALYLSFIFYFYSYAEEITLTTYYPSPYGSYAELRSDRMTIGDAYRTTAPPTDGLIVEGNVGIGTPTAVRKLDVNGYIGNTTTGSINLGMWSWPSGGKGEGTGRPLMIYDQLYIQADLFLWGGSGPTRIHMYGGNSNDAEISGGFPGSGGGMPMKFRTGRGGANNNDNIFVFERNNGTNMMTIEQDGDLTVNGNLTVVGEVSGSHGQKNCNWSGDTTGYTCPAGKYVAGFSCTGGCNTDNMAVKCCEF